MKNRPYFLHEVVVRVAYAVDPRMNCWTLCGSRGGLCAMECGEGGYCCRKGSSGCPNDMSAVATIMHHTCIRYKETKEGTSVFVLFSIFIFTLPERFLTF